MIHAVIDGQPYRISDESNNLVGSGGEADVYWFNPTQEFNTRYGYNRYVVKIFRKATTDALRRADVERQTKLEAFPSGLPSSVITPVSLVLDHNGQVIGYVMVFAPDGVPLIKLKKASFCQDNSISVEDILQIMANLHDAVSAVHARGIVIGDFNDKNVLATPNRGVFLLDADSFQYGKWECPAFVPGFVDPTIIKARSNNGIAKVGSHSTLTDWYAFTVMLFQLLVRIHPYTDGFYTSPAGEGPVKGLKRIHQRISVFHPRVSLPDMATPFGQLPPEILQCFKLVFEEGKRGSFPRRLLSTSASPSTAPPPVSVQPQRPAPTPAPPSRPVRPAPPPRPATPPCHMLAVSLQGGRLRYVYHQSGAYRREGGNSIWSVPKHDSQLSAYPAGERTVVASSSSFAVFDGNGKHDGKMQTQTAFGKATVAANGRHVYWLRNNELVRDNGRGLPTTIGKIAAQATSVWAGERFGLAVECNGILPRVLTFTEHPGLHTASLPPEFGSVVDAQCVISDELAWLTLSIDEDGGRVINRCYVFDSRAQLRATATAVRGDNTWLGSMTPAAHATGAKLVVPVPRTGIVRVGISGRQARQEIVYPDTSKLVPNKGATVGLTFNSQGVLHYSTTSIAPAATTL